jgi:diamine N-acetyltransferase
MWALTADEDPVIAAHGSVTLHDVTSMNWRAVATIEVEPRQREWVADVPRYLALCRYGGSWNPLAILAGADTVGFAMWARDPDAARYWIGGLVIDHRRQRSGYGGDALDAMIGYLADMPDCEAVALSYLPENVVARRLYSSHGFTETGEMEGDEIVAQLDLRRWA